ncbi:karyopherin (importin) beta [Anaeramoeba flamelloides]|uniref:Karyopherin (Importin) beta n=1 Tax=Anaeramoeba flamelloides TaxID=1746091 RepID=A0AAV7YF15_9EUKA|nr:karyopherin (importin) beta [Anaeramoeba flamelloides]
MNQDLKEFEMLLGDLMTPNNMVRSQAEEGYHTLVENKPQLVCYCLFGMLEFSSNLNTKSLAMLLLRRLVVNKLNPVWNKIPTEAQLEIKSKLLESLQNVESKYLSRRIADVIIAIKSTTSQETDEWPDLLPFLFKTLNNNENIKFQSLIIYILQELCYHLRSPLKKYHSEILNILSSALDPNTDLTLRVSALKSFSYYLLLLNNEEQKQINDIIPNILIVLNDLITNEEIEEAELCLQSLIETARHTTTIFQTHLKKILDFMINIFENELLSLTNEENENQKQNLNKNQKNENENEKYYDENDDEEIDEEKKLKFLILEFLVILLEKEFVLVLEIEDYINLLVNCCFSLLIKVKFETVILDWDLETDLHSFEINDVDIGESLLYRISNIVGGEYILPPSFEIIPDLLDSEDWRKRYGALKGLQSISEHSKELLTTELDSIILTVTPFLEEPAFLVLYQAINTIEQLCNDYSPTIQEKYHDLVLPSLIKCLQSESYYIQGNTCSALISFAEGVTEAEIMEDYIEEIMELLIYLLNSNYIPVKEISVSTIGAMALSIEENFEKYYDKIMQILKKQLIDNNNLSKNNKNNNNNNNNNNNSNEEKINDLDVINNLSLLNGKIIECISIIGSYVNKEKFEEDIVQVMELMIEIQSNNELEINSALFGYIFRAWSGICEILGNNFENYLPYLLPLIIQTIDQKNDIIDFEKELLNQENNIYQEQLDLEGYEIYYYNDQKIAIRSSILDQKKISIQLLYKLISNTPNAFSNYLEELTELILINLKEFSDSNIREYSAMITPHLLNILINGNSGNNNVNNNKTIVENISNNVVQELLITCEEEPIDSVLATQLDSLSECLEYCYPYVENDLKINCIKLLSQLLEESEKRKIDFEKKYDQKNKIKKLTEEKEELFEIEQNIWSGIYEILYQFIQKDVNNFWILWKENNLLDWYLHALKGKFGEFECNSAIMLFSEIFLNENTSQENFQKCWLLIGESIFSYLLEDNITIRKAAALAIGIIAENVTQDFSQMSIKIKDQLIQSIKKFGHNHPLKKKHLIICTDHLKCALGKVFFCHPESTLDQQGFQFWLNTLPIQKFEEDAINCIEYLCQWLLNNNQIVIGENNKNLPKIFEIIIHGIINGFGDQNTEKEIKKILIKLKESLQEQEILWIVKSIESKEISEKFFELLKLI